MSRPRTLEFVTLPAGDVVGTVTFRDGEIDASMPALADTVRPVWVRLGKNPAKAAAYFADWSNGYLQSRPASTGGEQRERSA
jgi:hypothetical protein